MSLLLALFSFFSFAKSPPLGSFFEYFRGKISTFYSQSCALERFFWSSSFSPSSLLMIWTHTTKQQQFRSPRRLFFCFFLSSSDVRNQNFLCLRSFCPSSSSSLFFLTEERRLGLDQPTKWWWCLPLCDIKKSAWTTRASRPLWSFFFPRPRSSPVCTKTV